MLSAFERRCVARFLKVAASPAQKAFGDLDENTLLSHFTDHGGEFGTQYASKEAYLEGARSFMDRAASEGNLFIQGSGTKVCGVGPGSGAFVSYDPSTRTIFTYMTHRQGWAWVTSQRAQQGWWLYPVAP